MLNRINSYIIFSIVCILVCIFWLKSEIPKYEKLIIEIETSKIKNDVTETNISKKKKLVWFGDIKPIYQKKIKLVWFGDINVGWK